MSASPSQNEYLTQEEEDQIEAAIADPSLISTHEMALSVMDALDQDIAGIEAQLEAARHEAVFAAPTADRLKWVRSATFAAAMKRSARHRVHQRDRELRGTKGIAQTPPKHSREEKAAKQAWLIADAEARKAKRQSEAAERVLQAARLAEERDWRKRFVTLAKERLGADVCAELIARAKALAEA